MFLAITRPLLLLVLLTAWASQLHASDLYRVELLLFERIHGEPELASATEPVSLPDHGLPLWVNTGWMSDTSADAAIDNESRAILKTPEIIPLPQQELRLDAIARSLRNESGYRVLALTGWHNELPVGYRSVPLVVELAANGDRERMIRGTLNLERRRYLHLAVNLSRLKAVEPRFKVAPIPPPRMTYPGVISGPDTPLDSDFLYPTPEKQWVTGTRLTELRRMRSEEIHYLDAPTFGLIVYFHPLRDEENDAGGNEESD